MVCCYRIEREGLHSTNASVMDAALLERGHKAATQSGQVFLARELDESGPCCVEDGGASLSIIDARGPR